MEILMLLFIARCLLQVAALAATEYATVMGQLNSVTVETWNVFDESHVSYREREIT